jgi:hemerythrin-like domain-containing protein
MNAATFVEALNTVEQDHHLVVDRVQVLQQLALALLEPEISDAPRLFARLRELNNYFATQFVTHLDEEETTLFPLLEQFEPEGPALAKRLRQEHEELRRRLGEFDSCLEIATELQDRPPRTVLEDLRAYTWDLWQLLDSHAHLETEGLHDCLTRYLLGKL